MLVATGKLFYVTFFTENNKENRMPRRAWSKYKHTELGDYAEIMVIWPQHPVCEIAKMKVYAYNKSAKMALAEWFNFSMRNKGDFAALPSRTIHHKARGMFEFSDDIVIERVVWNAGMGREKKEPKFRHFVFIDEDTLGYNDKDATLTEGIQLELQERFGVLNEDIWFYTQEHDDTLTIPKWQPHHRNRKTWQLALGYLESLSWPLTRTHEHQQEWQKPRDIHIRHDLWDLANIYHND